jgi:hypothetical protein
MKKIRHLHLFAAGLVLLVPALPIPSLSAQTTGKFVLTVHAKKSDVSVPVLHADDLAVTVNGEHARITSLAPLASEPIELLIAIDDGLRSSFNNQLGDLKKFLGELPENVYTAIGYMQHGQVVLAGNGFTKDHAAVIHAIRTPTGISGVNGSPYFVISDVCRHWPSKSGIARRELLMISDGVDRYTGLRYDPLNPYLQTAVKDAHNSNVLVDSIYYSATGMNGAGVNSGENYLQQLANETGGYFFNEGMSEPVSITGYLQKLKTRLANQYEVEFALPKGKPMSDAKLKVKLEERTLEAEAQDTVALKSGKSGR